VLRGLAVPLVLAGMVALSGVALGRIYHGPLLAQLMLGAAVGSVTVSAALRRAPAWTVAPLSVAGLTAYVAWAVQFSAGRADVPGGLLEVAADALRNGVPRLLTALIPIEPQPDTIVVPVIAAWLAGLAAAEVAVRAGRTLLGYLPPTLLYAGTLYVVGPNAGPATWPTLAYAALAATGLALTGRPGRAGPGGLGGLEASARAAFRLRTATSAAAGLAVIVALASLLGPAVAQRVATTPVDPRQYVEPPELDALDENPLIRLSGWALAPRQRLFDVRLDAGGDARAAGDARADTRIRLAVLSDYDGVTWRVGATYRTAGRALPPAPRAGQGGGDVRTQTVRQEITVADLSGKLVPAVPTPRLVDGVRVAYDASTGTLIRPEGLAPGMRYTVTSTAERPDVNLLPSADVPSGPRVARMLAVGNGTPEQIKRLAQQLGADNAGPYQRASAVEQFLAEHYRLVADAPSGHAYPNLSFFLFGPRDAGGQRGTSEQFAASFAVLARLLGLPTRIVVGFQSEGEGGTVRGADALAWPEVLFEDVGWVPFNPLPQPNTDPRPVEEDFRPKPDESTPPPTPAPTLSAVPTLPPTSAAAAPPPAREGGNPLALAGAVAAVAVLMAAVAYVVAVPLLRRAQRRRRLDQPDPARRVAGAWLEVTDALRLAGRPAGAHLAATEVAAYAVRAAGLPRSAHRGTRVRLPVPPLDELAAMVNVTAFAGIPADPGTAGRAGRAGDEALAYVQELRARRPWWRRVLWSLHPGPLRWHR
jgi:transglutaminase-like putative cysteine protease